MAESKEELKSLFLMTVKEESERAGLRLNIKKTKIMASIPITAWQMVGKKAKVVTDFLFLGSKITVNGDCSHEIKYEEPRQHIKKQRHHFAYSQGYSFSSNHVWISELDHK